MCWVGRTERFARGKRRLKPKAPGVGSLAARTPLHACGPYRAVLARHGITPSMSRRGNCLDNAPMGSFLASLKKEHVHPARFRPARERKQRCSRTSRCSAIGSACTRRWAIAPGPRPGPARKGSPCSRPPDVLIPPLHDPGGSLSGPSAAVREHLSWIFGPPTPLSRRLGPPLVGDRLHRRPDRRLIGQVVVPDGLEIIIQLVDQRLGGGDVELDDLLLGDVVQVLDQRA